MITVDKTANIQFSEQWAFCTLILFCCLPAVVPVDTFCNLRAKSPPLANCFSLVAIVKLPFYSKITFSDFAHFTSNFMMKYNPFNV